MQIIIKIDEELYNYMQTEKYDKHLDKRFDYQVRFAVRNGTPLPKRHGNLIDVNDLLDDIGLEDNDYNRDTNTGEIITLENIDRIPTIIEADKAESEE